MDEWMDGWMEGGREGDANSGLHPHLRPASVATSMTTTARATGHSEAHYNFFYAPWRYVALQTVHNGSPASNPTTHGAAQRKTIDSWPILARGSHSPVEWPGPQQSQYLHAYRHSRPLTWHAGANWGLSQLTTSTLFVRAPPAKPGPKFYGAIRISQRCPFAQEPRLRPL